MICTKDLTPELFCSLGAAYPDQASCTSDGGVWARNQRSGSHNLIAGYANAYTQFGGLIAGGHNVISGTYAAVSGGLFNTASGPYSSVSGGYGRTTVDVYDWRAGSLFEDQ